MTVQKPTVHQNTIMATLTDEELELLEAFAAEQGIEDLSAAIPAMLHELLRLHDAWWDSQLEHRPPKLVKEAKAALEEYEASKTETLDTDS